MLYARDQNAIAVALEAAQQYIIYYCALMMLCSHHCVLMLESGLVLFSHRQVLECIVVICIQ